MGCYIMNSWPLWRTCLLKNPRFQMRICKWWVMLTWMLTNTLNQRCIRILIRKYTRDFSKNKHIFWTSSTYFTDIFILHAKKHCVVLVILRFEICQQILNNACWPNSTAWVSEWIWMLNVTCNDISVMIEEEVEPNDRHFVVFFIVPVQAPTPGHPFYGYSEKSPSTA